MLYSVVAAALAAALGLLIAFPIARRLLRGHSGCCTRCVFVGLFLPLSVIPLFAEARMLRPVQQPARVHPAARYDGGHAWTGRSRWRC